MSQIVISSQQRTLHMVSQAMAVLITVPFMFYASKNLPNKKARDTARMMAWSALAVDGYLLYRFATQTTDEPFL